MSRTLSRVVFAVLICVGTTLGSEDKQAPKDRSTFPGEKVDARGNRVVTGTIESIETKDERNGVLLVRIGKDAPGRKFWVDSKTKVLRATADPLEEGLKSPVLKGAEVRITFLARPEKGEQPDLPVCQTVQLLKPEK